MKKVFVCLKSVNNVPIGQKIELEEEAAAEFIGTHLVTEELYADQQRAQKAVDDARKKAEADIQAARKAAALKPKGKA